MIFRLLLDRDTSTQTYLLADEATREALLIDCVFEQHLRDLALLRELDLKLKYTLETHVHADHVTGAWLMKQATGSQITVAAASGAQGMDLSLAAGDRVFAGEVELEVRATPGHTDGCVTYVAAKCSMAFTGDALLIRGAGRTDFQHGDAHQLFRSVRERILTLPSHFLLYPGHDYSGRTVTSVAEERAHNPRLGDHVREEDFVAYMKNLGLPHPRRIASAVPANLACGRPPGGLAPQEPGWAPLVRTYAGVWQVEPEWVHQHRAEVRILDVREEQEVQASPLGAIPDSVLSPLSELRVNTSRLSSQQPLVVVCPSGARSAIATSILEQAGLKAANLRGGLLGWVELGLPLESSSS